MARSDFVKQAFLQEKVDSSETIAVFDLKVSRCRQLIEFMEVCEYSRTVSLFDLGPR